MSKRKPARGPKKLTALITSVLITAAAFLYMLFGESIAPLLRQLGIDTTDLIRIVRPITEGCAEVHFIDVGQGDSILIRTVDHAVLIDTGTNLSEDILCTYLAAGGVSKIDLLVLTHPHEDHIGGADRIFDEFTVGRLMMPNAASESVTYEKVLSAAKEEGVSIEYPYPGDTFALGDLQFTVLAPLDPAYTTGTSAPVTESEAEGNAASIVLRLDYGTTSFLFTGDAEEESEAAMLERWPVWKLDCDVLKLGHHGSNTSTSEAFLQALTPEWVIASCGAGNDYGHPHREILNRLRDCGLADTAILRTDRDSTVLFISDGTKIEVY